MTEILKHLLWEYRSTGNVFHPVIKLKNKFGNDISDTLNDLYKKGWIRKREYVNGRMVELIKFE